MLTPLSTLEAEELLGHLRGETEVEETLLGRITEAAEGNPLFVEQLLAMIAENGAAAGTPQSALDSCSARGTARSPGARRARRDRGGGRHRKEFWRGAIGELVSGADRGAVGASLMTLARKEFIEPARSIFPRGRLSFPSHPDPRRRLPRCVQRDEGRPARAVRGWLERSRRERRRARRDRRHHLEQAHRYREELGPLGPGVRSLRPAPEKGSRRREQSGRSRGRRRCGTSLITRAVSLLPDETRCEASYSSSWRAC